MEVAQQLIIQLVLALPSLDKVIIMSDLRIIYPNEETGGICLICPAPGININDVIKDIPEGKPYKIINVSDLPDFTFFDAWEYIE